MSKIYDPQYDTQPNFNAPIVEGIVLNKNIDKINHWIDNGNPHKRLAEVAFIASLKIDWMDGVNAIWNSGWCSNKGLLTKAWNHIVASRMKEDDFKNSNVCEWLVNKTFKENFLSKSELNNLGVSILELANYHHSSYIWDMFFKVGLNLKGAKAESLFDSLYYFRYYNENNKGNNHQIRYSQDEVDTYQKRIDQVLKNSIQISNMKIFIILLKRNEELFWKIIESNLIIDKKDLTVLFVFLTMYFKQFVKYSKKENVNVDDKLESILRNFIRLGLPEKVTLTKKDIEDKYAIILDRGMGYFSLRSMPDFGYLGSYLAKHIGYIEYSNYSYSKDKREVIDFDIYNGDVFFANPVDKRGKGYYDDISYVELTEEQKKSYRDKMKLKIEKYK